MADFDVRWHYISCEVYFSTLSSSVSWRAGHSKPPAAVALMRGVKSLMDPRGILNPYKVGWVVHLESAFLCLKLADFVVSPA